MSVSKNLRKLAQKLQRNADEVLEEAEKNPTLFNIVVDSVAAAVGQLESVADALEEIEPTVTPELLETVAYLAEALDETDDEILQKKASQLDELLLTISAPKNAIAQAKKQSEDELERLRQEYRKKNRDALYQTRTREALDKMNQKQKTQDLIKDQVKEYRVLQAPLQTRYCPDHPGVGMTRIADRIFQCGLDHKIYNYETGYTTMKGNKVPGGGVENQMRDWNYYNGGAAFDTRKTFMSRYAKSEEQLTKQAQQKDYAYGMAHDENGNRYVEVRVASEVPEERRRQIAKEIQGTMGSLYPIKFKTHE